MSDALASFTTVGSREVSADPRVLKAIGLGHSLESALADIVDNSIDAHAERVLIRFVEESSWLTSVLVIDNGDGMDRDAIDGAMSLGRQSKDPQKLGHFGVGLKSASFSNAEVLTVLSHTQGGEPLGRSMSREQNGGKFEVDDLDESQVRTALGQTWIDFTTAVHGTIVRWEKLRNVSASRDRERRREFRDSAVMNVQNYLGLVFQRILERGEVTIEIDVIDAVTGLFGFPFEVKPIDPFAYPRTGAPGYPKSLYASIGKRKIALDCHIWPRSDSPSFNLWGKPVEQFQGFYIYRNDRLLSAGGWHGVEKETKRRRSARVCLEVSDFTQNLDMNAEKSNVRLSPDLENAIESAMADDGTTFANYLADAEAAFKEANKRVSKRTAVLEPGKGLAPRVKRTIERELNFVQGEAPVAIKWKEFRGSDFIEVDRRNQTLWLNAAYRPAVLHGTHAGMNDAPLIKTLLYLLYEDIFRGTAFGAKDKDNVNLWGEILNAAAHEEIDDGHE